MNTPTQIGISKNGTTRLDTAGKYCDRPIDIIAEIPAGEYNISAIENEDGSQDINITDATLDDKSYIVTVMLQKIFGAPSANSITVYYISENGVESSVDIELGQEVQIKVYRHSCISILERQAKIITEDYVIMEGSPFCPQGEYEGTLYKVDGIVRNTYITVRIDHNGYIAFQALESEGTDI